MEKELNVDYSSAQANKVFNADLIGAFNILITLSPISRCNGLKTQPRTKSPNWGDVVPNLPALAETLTL